MLGSFGLPWFTCFIFFKKFIRVKYQKSGHLSIFWDNPQRLSFRVPYSPYFSVLRYQFSGPMCRTHPFFFLLSPSHFLVHKGHKLLPSIYTATRSSRVIFCNLLRRGTTERDEWTEISLSDWFYSNFLRTHWKRKSLVLFLILLLTQSSRIPKNSSSSYFGDAGNSIHLTSQSAQISSLLSVLLFWHLNLFHLKTHVDIHMQAVFASWIPEITELVGNRTKYGGEHRVEHGKRYICCYPSKTKQTTKQAIKKYSCSFFLFDDPPT